jgi:simple sugar transport system substrate-binding protein
MLGEFLAGEENPTTVLYLGMDSSMVLADGTEIPTVDIMNDNKVGVDAISPAALPLIPEAIVQLVMDRRDQMIAGDWDPFTELAFVSNGTGLALEGTPIPAAGTAVKAAGETPTDDWLLSQFNFDVKGVTILE